MIERWQLAKNTRSGRKHVRCVEAPHPLGVELRVTVDPDDLRRSEVFRERDDADRAAAEWRGVRKVMREALEVAPERKLRPTAPPPA